jgi:hypothetical protein
MDHDEWPFRVVASSTAAFTRVDRSLYVTLAGMDAVHEGFLSDAQMSGGPSAGPSAERRRTRAGNGDAR